MPPKLQVDESFAFLFTCIEASGCKIDFKLVGDATDLQPAAARMRYTRLRKAVESGDFRGATLTQPMATVVSSRLSQLANPQARRFGGSGALTGDTQRHPQEDRDRAIHRHGSRKRAATPISIDDDDDEDEEVHEDPGQTDFEVDKHQPRRRRRSTIVESDDGLFFPDTSESSRIIKKIKRSHSVEEADQHQPRLSSRTNDYAGRSACLSENSKVIGRNQEFPMRSIPHVDINDRYQQEIDDDSPTARSSSTLRASEQPPSNIRHVHSDHHTLTDSSRKKHSANNAAEAAYTLGIQTGRFAPALRNLNDTFSNQSFPANHASRLGYVGQGIHSTAVNPHAYHLPMSSGIPQNPYARTQFSYPYNQVPAATNTITRIEHHDGRIRYPPAVFNSSNYLPHANSNPHPQSRNYDPNDHDRFNPASVFKGFQAPTVMRQSPSSASTNHRLDANGNLINSSRPVSLLQKVKMDRDKDIQKAVERREGEGKESPVMKKRESHTPQANHTVAGSTDAMHDHGHMRDNDPGQSQNESTVMGKPSDNSTRAELNELETKHDDTTQNVHEDEI